MNSKYNEKKINFHQFLFLFVNRIRLNNRLVTKTLIDKYMNSLGFYISEVNNFLYF